MLLTSQPLVHGVSGRFCNTLLTRGSCLRDRPWTVSCTTTRALQDGSRAEGGLSTLTGVRVMRHRAKTLLLVRGRGEPRLAWVAVLPSGER
jgi:hypothetical protein